MHVTVENEYVRWTAVPECQGKDRAACFCFYTVNTTLCFTRKLKFAKMPSFITVCGVTRVLQRNMRPGSH
jgi:hypothetical protein